ncbi:hypothetical protein HD554DRAFT_2060090 [Boletus coccyginus]|nr:hypothetical protein HD554DRAFT_2060090 [Boletus coccyginus]
MVNVTFLSSTSLSSSLVRLTVAIFVTSASHTFPPISLGSSPSLPPPCPLLLPSPSPMHCHSSVSLLLVWHQCHTIRGYTTRMP